MMLMATSMAFMACDSDIDSNPVLAHKAPAFTLNTPEFAGMTVDLAKAETYPLTWSQPEFLSPNAPTVVTYTVNLSKDGQFTKSYAEAIAEAGDDGVPSGHNYVTLKDDATNQCSLALKADVINLAINQLYNTWDEQTEMQPLTLYATVTASVLNAPLEAVASSTSNVVEMKFTPYWVDVNKQGDSYIYVPGNGQGWAPDSAPTLICNTGDDVYVGYAYLDGDFKFTIKRNWNDGEYNAGSFTSASDCISLDNAADGGNLTYTGEASLCYIIADIANKTLDVTPVKWSLIGLGGDWETDLFMTYDTAAKALVARGVDVSGEWKFRRDSAWDFNYGGSLGALEHDGANLSSDGVHDVYLYLECNGMGPGTDTEEPVRYAEIK